MNISTKLAVVKSIHAKTKVEKFKFKRAVAVKERDQDVEWPGWGRFRRECCQREFKTEKLTLKDSQDEEDVDLDLDADADNITKCTESAAGPKTKLPAATTLLDYFPVSMGGTKADE